MKLILSIGRLVHNKSILGKWSGARGLLTPTSSIGQIRRHLGEALFSHTQPLSSTQRKRIGMWLIGCAGMVYGAVTVGGLTRLTESGLSMVNWDLFKTMKPPFSQHEWEEEFERYRQYPEYKMRPDQSTEMSLSKFKFIWTMEYLHRMWGRATGLVFLLPCAYFWARGRFSDPMKIRMTVAGSLLVSQGLLGWWMVKSGLDPSGNSNKDVARVSQYRLASHLSLAFVLYSVYLWTGLSHLLTPNDYTQLPKIGRLRGMVHGSKALIFVTALMGAFVAGLDAGLVYNSWPKYADRWWPEGMLSKDPKWRNLFENEVTAQFVHRSLAYLTLLSITLTWLAGRRMHLTPRAKLALHAMMTMGYAQAAIGISTLVYYVPIWLAALHQNGALVLMTFAFWLSNEIRRVPK